MANGRIWRIRMNPERERGVHEDVTKRAWEMGEVGIWYGVWTADDLYCGLTAAGSDDSALAAFLSRIQAESGVPWKINTNYARLARRFAAIKEDDWIFTHFSGALHFAHVFGPVRSNPDHRLNGNGDLFKYRQIVGNKGFDLHLLPDSFLLLPSAGRANVYQLHDTNHTLVELLANHTSEQGVAAELAAMPLRKWLELLGPSEWESLCLGYLIKEEGLLPTGVVVGRTLPTFDIVGRDRCGCRIFAQCKKNLAQVEIDEHFKEYASTSGDADSFTLPLAPARPRSREFAS